MKKKSVLLFILVIIAFVSLAQDSVVTTISRNRYANIDFGVGYMHTDLSNINGFLSTYGYKPMSEDIITLSIAPSFSVSRLVFRGEFTWQFRVVMPQPENSTSAFGGRHAAASVGYLLIDKPGYRFYPYVGISSFASHLTVREKTSVSTVDDLVNNQQQGFQLVYSNASLDVGFQFDKLISLRNGRWDCPQSNRYMTLGLRVGYLFGPTVKGRFNGQIVEGAPAYSPNGPYIKLVMGFSTKMRDLKWKK
jgi:hypothetical protein